MKEETKKTVYCEYCKKEVPWHTNPVNHGGQLVLAIVTLWLWIPMWLAMAFSKAKVCDVCNRPVAGE